MDSRRASAPTHRFTVTCDRPTQLACKQWPAAEHNRGREAPTGALILIIDDDAGTRENFEWALRPLGFGVRTARCGAEGIRIAQSDAFDLLLVDFGLPDMHGTDLIRRLQIGIGAPPFVLISAFLTTAITVDAMRLGALDVLEKPIWIDDLPDLLFSVLQQPSRSQIRRSPRDISQPARLIPAARHARDVKQPGSAAERWAMHAIKGCQSDTDLKTLEQWASCAGVSYTSLRESCRLAGMRAFDARDLVRVLRAVMLAAVCTCPPEVLLDVNDARTLDRLRRRSGLECISPPEKASIEVFFEHQQFIPRDNAAVRLLRTMVRGVTLSK
jgi:CheY-like chemotaxis protein